MFSSSECLVVGSGPVGILAGITLARMGRQVTVVGSQALPQRDGRTVALLMASIDHLERLGIWTSLKSVSAPLVKMRIIDMTGSLLHVPPVKFGAMELGDDAFGYNIELADFVAALQQAATNESNLSLIDASAADLKQTGHGKIVAELSNGMKIEAGLVVGADGKDSKVRNFVGINAKNWDYGQAALTAIMSHDRDHADISTEFHTREGPFTLVPLPGRRSSLVWMMKPHKASELFAFTDEAFADAVEQQSQFILGRVKIVGGRSVVPMSGMRVDRFGVGCAAIVGEAAHVFPPIGAQGLNLGIRDLLALELACKTASPEKAVLKYDQLRRADVVLRTAAVDLMNRSILADLVPVDFARSLGLLTISQIPPLRQFVMRRGSGR
jgi:2-octaprenyl-6-methoxyphenol hydroxylase